MLVVGLFVGLGVGIWLWRGGLWLLALRRWRTWWGHEGVVALFYGADAGCCVVVEVVRFVLVVAGLLVLLGQWSLVGR